MNAERWEYLKALKPSNGVFAHVSKTFTAIRGLNGEVLRYQPDMGKTYNIGRNAKKRAERMRKHLAYGSKLA